MDVILLIIVGMGVGFAGGYAGIGGAPILVAALVLGLGVDQHAAQGTILAVMLGPMSLPGVIVMWDRVRLMRYEIAIGVVAYALFSNLGARIAFTLETDTLTFAFGLLLCVLGGHYLMKRAGSTSGPALNPAAPTVGDGVIPFTNLSVGISATVIGIAGGLFGIGAGVLMVPLFISLFALHKDDARALSLAILLPPVSLGAVLEYGAHDRIDWVDAAIIFALYFSTNHFGAKFGRKHDTRVFLRAMGITLVALGITTVVMSR